MAISYEAAAEVAKNLLGAVEAISAEQAKLAAVRTEASKIKAEADAVNAQTGEANKALRATEQTLAEKRRELDAETVKFNEVYEKRVAEEGKLNVARTQLEALRQHVAG